MRDKVQPIDVCVQKLRLLQSQYSNACQKLDFNEIPTLRLKIKQIREKIRTLGARTGCAE